MMGVFHNVLRLAMIGLAVAIVWPYVFHYVEVIGLLRTPSKSPILQEEDYIRIPDTTHCEDVHYYSPANTLFTACEDNDSTRYGWFPPLAIFDRPEDIGQGSIHVIDPETMMSRRLRFENFSGPFVTHGIDVIADPATDNAVFILAVNHLPNPSYELGGTTVPKARSQIEIFHHLLGSQSVQYLRSVSHSLISTPNDIIATSPTSFYLTNDHYYREGPLRLLEDAIPAAKWSSIIHVEISSLDASDSDGINASVAYSGLHNNNGLSRGPRISRTEEEEEVVVTSSCSGVFHRMSASFDQGHNLSLVESIPTPSSLDNPSYLSDPYKTEKRDISGYILPGLTKGFLFTMTYLEKSAIHPGVVWYVPTSGDGDWKIKKLYEDDGSRLSSITSAVVVPDEPEGEKRKGWLFMTGVMAKNMIAVKVEF